MYPHHVVLSYVWTVYVGLVIWYIEQYMYILVTWYTAYVSYMNLKVVDYTEAKMTINSET